MMVRLWCIAVLLNGTLNLMAQEPALDGSTPSVPALVSFNSVIRGLDGAGLSGLRDVTFSLYADEEGGASVWSETQAVQIDTEGGFTVLLGSATSGGIPADVFGSGAIRWVGIMTDDRVERPRVLIAAVPYAFKAAESDTLGGFHAEDFVSVRQLSSLLGRVFEAGPSSISYLPQTSGQAEPSIPSVNVGLLPSLSDSAFARLGAANVFEQSQSFRGGAHLPAVDPESDETNFLDSAPVDFESSIIQPQSAPYHQIFRWISQPTDSLSGNPTARLTLLYGMNPAKPAPTGFSFNSDGTINFAPNQVLPSAAVMSALAEGQNGPAGGSASGGKEPPVVNTGAYGWAQTPASSALTVGANIVTLAPCPKGINGNDVWHFLYISKTGTPEVVLITGGSCISRQTSGTIEFTAQYAHPAGYSIGSATDGIQEAFVDAAVAKVGGAISRNVLIDPGPHLLRARLSVRASGITITASGATLTCAMADTCIMLGDPSNSNAFGQIVISGLRLAAGVSAGTWAAVEDNALGATISDFSPATSAVTGASFGSLVQVDNDQAAHITGVNILAPWSRCDTSFCSTAIVGPGVNGDAGVIWVDHSNLSLACTANGIDNQDGNTLHVSDSVVQAFPQFGVRSRSTYGNTPSVQMTNVYQEIGNCVNPLGTGMAGLIVENGYANVTASVGPAGELPVFANTGTTQYSYSIVVHSNVMGTSPAYLAGYANTNGAGAVPVVWNQVGNTGTVTYDVLRTTGVAAPFGTGMFAVATGIPASSCSNKVCSFSDDGALPPSSYTVSTQTDYWPALKLWPGSVILTTAYDYQNTGGGAPTDYFTDVLNVGQSSGIVNSAGGFEPSVFAQLCEMGGPMTSVWTQCLGGNAYSNDNGAVTGTVLQLSNNGGSSGGLKGRLIFEMTPNSNTAATHVITLADSNPAKTMATPNNRPTSDPSDTYIGYDNPSTGALASQTQLSFGSPTSISNYIGNTGDNIHWGERLTSNMKIFQVPVQINSNLTIAGNLFASGPVSLSSASGPSFAWQPTASVKDNFPGSGSLGGNWINTDGAWGESNNQAYSTANSGEGYAAAANISEAFSPDQFAEAQVFNVAGGTLVIGVGVRMSSTSLTGYFCYSDGPPSVGGTTTLTAVSFASGYSLGSGPGLPNGDYIRVGVVGSQVTCYDNGVPIITATDSSLTSGYPGLFSADGVGYGKLANFFGGNFVYALQGTVQPFTVKPAPFSRLALCTAVLEGTSAPVTDSAANSWGETITGGGPNHVMGYCDGSAWTVSAR